MAPPQKAVKPLRGRLENISLPVPLPGVQNDLGLRILQPSEKFLSPGSSGKSSQGVSETAGRKPSTPQGLWHQAWALGTATSAWGVAGGGVWIPPAVPLVRGWQLHQVRV